MAILSFPKNPVCLLAVVLRALPSASATQRAHGRAARLAALPMLALLQAGLFLPASPASAQTPGPPAQAAAPTPGAASPQAAVAAGALWTRPVAPAAWTVTFKYGSVVAAQQAAHRPNMVKVTLVGKESLETIHFPERTAEVWRTEGVAIVSEAGSEQAGLRQDQGLGNVAGVGGNSDLVSGVSRDKNGNFTATINGVFVSGKFAQEEPDWSEFKEFDWVTPAMLKGKIELSGQKLLVYADMEPEAPAPAAGTGKGRAAAPAASKFPPGPLGGLPLKPGIRVAAIEETSKIPRYLQMGENIQIYAFSKPQQTKLELPPKVTALLAKPAPPPEGAKAISLIP